MWQIPRLAIQRPKRTAKLKNGHKKQASRIQKSMKSPTSLYNNQKMWDQSQPQESMQSSQHQFQLFQQEIFGMRFCQKCRNLMKPFHGNGHLLEYLCERCNKTVPVDYSDKEGRECLLYSKELQIGSRKMMADPAYVFDPAMPRVEVECPECNNNRAVYILTPDEGETKLKVIMICASTSGTVVKCGHSWVLDQGAQLLQYRVKTEDEVFFDNFEA